MRRLRAAGAAVVMCLALGALPTAAQSPSAEPAWVAVTGTSTCEGPTGGTQNLDSAPYWARDFIFRCTNTASDPRVTGPGTMSFNLDTWDPTFAAGISWWDITIEGPDGTWTGHGSGVWDKDGVLHAVTISVGSGAYEGLLYATSGTAGASGKTDFVGLIQPGSPPPGITATPSSTPSPAPSLATIGQPADDGARIVEVETIDARMRDLTIESPSVGTVKVRLLLPSTFEAQPTTRWPVLYLLHGAGGSHAEWTQNTDVEALTAPTDLLVVMPDANDAVGGTGWYTDWYNGGEGGPPKWETFHLTELRQLLERNWQAGDDRVIAGLSMGGYGAITYAARHPELFKAAASCSGVLDLKVNPDDFSDPDVITRWGDPVADAANWDKHDPIKLVPLLKGMPLYIAYGNGEPGPLDPSGAEKDGLEAWIGQGGDLFVAALKDAGIPATVNAYGAGTHTWPYWQRELHASLPMLLEALGESGVLPSPTPGASPSVAPGVTSVTGRDTCDFTDYPVIRCTEQASDPRVSGSATRTITLEPPFPDQGALMWNDVIITGPEGTWTGTGYGVMGKDSVIHNLEIMSGSGAYRGLVYST